MRQLILVGLLAFAVALTGTAYAEVQNIKVSGDIDMKAISHNNYDLQVTQKNIAGNHPDNPADSADAFDDDATLILSTVRLKVDADLTDNVSTSVRLLNQRFWDTDVDATNNIDIDNAYVVLKEFLYSPLTVIAGRQDLNYGTGFIVGPGLLGDPNTTFTDDTVVDADGTGGEQSQIAQEYSAYNAYDALRVILDYAPITVEGLYAKINETGASTGGDTDQTLFGALVNYKLDQWSVEVEPYWFYKRDDDGIGLLTVDDAVTSSNTARTYETIRTHTVGLRLAGSPIENLQLNGEGAYQLGSIIDDTQQRGGGDRDRSAWGATVDGRYTWAQVPWTPATGIGWVFYSGEETNPVSTADSSDDLNAWDPMFRGSFTTYIQDFLTGRHVPANALYVTRDPDDTSAATNRHLLYLDVGAKPLEDVNIWARYTHAWFDEEPRPGRSSTAGDEVDVKATYDYTEDVQLAAFGGWFFPGSYYDEAVPNSRGSDLAWTVGGGGSVKF